MRRGSSIRTGTMFAVIGYFWKVWRERYFASAAVFRQQAKLIIVATAATGAGWRGVATGAPMAGVLRRRRRHRSRAGARHREGWGAILGRADTPVARLRR